MRCFMISVRFFIFIVIRFRILEANCPAAMKEVCAQAEMCYTALCDVETGNYKVAQCEAAKPCAICYPDSTCAGGNGGSSQQSNGSSDPDIISTDSGGCNTIQEISSAAFALADGFASFNDGAGSSLYNMSACSFEHLLSTDIELRNTPIHLILFFSTKVLPGTRERVNDVSVVSSLSEAAKSVGGAVVLRNRVILELDIGANYVVYAGFPNPAALRSLLDAKNKDIHNYWKAFVKALIDDTDTVTISISRLTVDVRPPKPPLANSFNISGVDCAYKPAVTFDPDSELPWPERPGQEMENMLISQGDEGGLVEVLNFNKLLPAEKQENATFDYIFGVTKAGLRHGFLSEPKFGCMKDVMNCQSLQLVGSKLMGYNDIFGVQYPSVRALLSMLNDENWIFEQKQDEFEWSKGILTTPIFGDEVEVLIPQMYLSGDETSYVGANFADVTGFPKPSTPCNDDAKLGLLNEEIANDICLENNSGFIISTEMAEACMSLFTEQNSDCSAECVTQIMKIQACVDPLQNTYNMVDTYTILQLQRGGPAVTLVPTLSARGWYLEVMRRGCNKIFLEEGDNSITGESVTDAKEGTTKTSASLSFRPHLLPEIIKAFIGFMFMDYFYLR